MIVNVKLMNGDLISIEMNVYSEQALRDSLRSEYNEGFFNIHPLHEYENGDKDVLAIILPVHIRGHKFERVLRRLKRHAEQEHRDQSHRSTMRSYFRKILRLLSDDDAIRGDSYVNESETALEAFTTFILECETDLLRSLFGVRNIILDCYGQLCKTTADFDNVINRICDLKIKDNYAEDYGFLEENHLYTRGRLLNTINDVREIELFADVSEDIAHADENVQPRLTYNQILWLLKDFMRRVNEGEDDD